MRAVRIIHREAMIDELSSENGWGSGPVIVAQFSKKQGGVDPLGLRQVNLDLMALCLPGLTNNTKHVRAFSLLCWIHWMIQKQAKSTGLHTLSRTQQRVFQQKVETLFTWGHKLAGVSGVPGLRSSPPPPEEGGRVDLGFGAWGRKPGSTSLQAAVQYGPALKVRNGYGFVEPLPKNFFRATQVGEQMAKHLDQQLRKSSRYGLITDLERAKARPTDAKSLFDTWSIENLSSGERHVFESVFYRVDFIDGTDAQSLRSATIHAILQILRASRSGLNEDEVRRALAWQWLPSGKQIQLRGGPLRAAKHWMVLQVRQAQRAALEWLLTWVEHKLFERACSTGDLARVLIDELEGERFSESGSLTCEQTLARFQRGFRGFEDYCKKSSAGHERCIFEMMYALTNSADATSPEILQRLVGLHLSTLMLSTLLEADPTSEKDLREGGVRRISLSYQLERWRKCKGQQFSVWMTDLLERWIIGQHMSVATLRDDGRSKIQRLRFSLEEHGFDFYPEKPLRPDISRDHLAAALSLMSEIRLIERGENGVFHVA